MRHGIQAFLTFLHDDAPHLTLSLKPMISHHSLAPDDSFRHGLRLPAASITLIFS